MRCLSYIHCTSDYVVKKFEEYDITDEEEITYSQWESVDRTELRKHTTPIEEFVDLLVYKVDNLSTHSYIAKSQARHLKARKEAMENDTCVILLDFAENYHYIVQDEVQGIIGIRTSAHFIQWLSTTKMNKTRLFIYHCASSPMTWIMRPALCTNFKN